MKARTRSVTVTALAFAALTACASSGYNPPPERRASDRCPSGEVWICEDRYPTRIESENRPEPFCHCGQPRYLR